MTSWWRNLKQHFSAHLWEFISLVALAFLYLLPFIVYPAFNLIDDGWSLYVAQQLSQNLDLKTWGSFLYETDAGRLRPLYYLYFVVAYQFGGYQPVWYWLGHALTLGVTLCLSYLIVFATSNSKKLAFLASALILTLPATAENYFRLGTAEVRQLVLVLLFVLVVFRTVSTIQFKTYLYASAVFLLALFSKESSIVLAPWYCLVLFSAALKSELSKSKFLLFTLGILLISAVFYVSIPKGGYSSQFAFSLLRIKENFLTVRSQQPILWHGVFLSLELLFLSTVLLLKGTFLDLKQKITLVQKPTLLFILGLLFTIINLPWPHQFERYYFPSYVLFLLGFAGAVPTLTANFQELTNSTISRKVATSLALIFMVSLVYLNQIIIFKHTPTQNIFENIKKSAVFLQTSFNTHQSSYALIQAVQNLPPATTIYVGHNDYEVIYEVGLYANFISEIPKNSRILSQNQQLVDDFSDEYPYLEYTEDIFTEMKKDPQNSVLYALGKQQVLYPEITFEELTPKTHLFNKLPSDITWYQGRIE